MNILCKLDLKMVTLLEIGYCANFCWSLIGPGYLRPIETARPITLWWIRSTWNPNPITRNDPESWKGVTRPLRSETLQSEFDSPLILVLVPMLFPETPRVWAFGTGNEKMDQPQRSSSVTAVSTSRAYQFHPARAAIANLFDLYLGVIAQLPFSPLILSFYLRLTT